MNTKKQIRITSGSAKNKKLKAPDIEGFRAVQEKAKLAIFAILTPTKIKGAEVLDLFAGSGNLGIEALSRGASWCDLVDESRYAARVIEENLFTCGFYEQAEIFENNAVKFVAETNRKYDIIFADPFFADTAHKYLLENMQEILKKDGYIVFSHGKQLQIEALLEGTSFEIETTRRYGNAFITFITFKKVDKTKEFA